MSNSRKLYIKALKSYNDGYIDKVADLCDKSIALDMDAPSMNLKGLIYYLKGEFDNAERIWRMNSSANNDSVSRKYIEDAQSDKRRMKLFDDGVKLYNDVNIAKALEIFNMCSESDFNSINVNNYLTSCWLKMGDYNNALKHIEKVMTFDKKNIIAVDNKRIITEFGGIDKRESSKPILYIVSALAALILAVIFYNIISKNLGQSFKFESKVKDNKVAVVQKSSSQNISEAYGKDSAKTSKDSSQVESSFPVEDIQRNMDSGNFDKLYEEVSMWKDKSLNTNNSILLVKAVSLLRDSGVKDFYIKGCSFKSSGDYVSSQKYLMRAYEYGKNNYLYQSVLYTLAGCLENSGDAAGALKYYEEYDSLYYPKGEYEPTVLYNMTMIFKDLDATKSREYAAKLSKTFSDSIYNNGNIKAILNTQ
jgi:tetratricopeptide (TPR) repeat protein